MIHAARLTKRADGRPVSNAVAPNACERVIASLPGVDSAGKTTLILDVAWHNRYSRNIAVSILKYSADALKFREQIPVVAGLYPIYTRDS